MVPHSLAWFPRFPTYMVLIHQRHRQSGGQTDRSQYHALHKKRHRVVKTRFNCARGIHNRMLLKFLFFHSGDNSYLLMETKFHKKNWLTWTRFVCAVLPEEFRQCTKPDGRHKQYFTNECPTEHIRIRSAEVGWIHKGARCVPTDSTCPLTDGAIHQLYCTDNKCSFYNADIPQSCDLRTEVIRVKYHCAKGKENCLLLHGSI